ncbi:MAG: hypothetical protein V4526_01760 [Patescibacteria group bacterium]
MAVTTIHGKVLDASFEWFKKLLASSQAVGHHINIASGNCRFKFKIDEVRNKQDDVFVELKGKNSMNVEGIVRIDLRTKSIEITYA